MEKKVFVFVHIPKTSGMYIKNSIKRNQKKSNLFFCLTKTDNPLLLNQHVSIKEYKKEITQENLNHTTFFAIVRNPYDRIYSLWNFFLRSPKLASVVGVSIPKKFDDFVINYCNDLYIKQYDVFRSQLFFLEGEDIDKIKILKFEDRKSINNFLLENHAFYEDKDMNGSIPISTKNYIEFYTEELKEMLYIKLQEEFTSFNYSK